MILDRIHMDTSEQEHRSQSIRRFSDAQELESGVENSDTHPHPVPVPIPLSVYWREFRTRIVPGLVFILSIIALIRLWGSVIPDPESDNPVGNSLVLTDSTK